VEGQKTEKKQTNTPPEGPVGRFWTVQVAAAAINVRVFYRIDY